MSKHLVQTTLITALCLASASKSIGQDTESGRLWRLQSLDGASVTAEVTLSLGPDGAIAGSAGCNRYVGQSEATLPDFAAGPLATTRMACPDMEIETAYLAALAAMTTAELGDDRLVLSAPGGAQLVFEPAD